jgi:putative SbcD/Mre11-related phosphoesterase
MRAEVVPNEPAIILKGRCKVLVVADLHLGLVEFYDKPLIEKLNILAEIAKADEILVLGDLKHRIWKSSRIEKIIQTFEIPITLVKGNHDGRLDCLEVLSSRGIRIGKFGLFHGHAMPDEDVMQAKTMIFAHAHPSVLIRDYIGGTKVRVWLFGEFDGKDVVVMPAFNDLCASTAVNLEKPAGVIFKRWDYKKADAIMLDGTYLGRVEML